MSGISQRAMDGGANMPMEGRYSKNNPFLGVLLEFILYSRSNCHLCEAMEDELSPFIENHNIIVNRQYIDNEPALEQKYGNKVPVLTFEGKMLCEYFLDTDKLQSLINQSHD